MYFETCCPHLEYAFSYSFVSSKRLETRKLTTSAVSIALTLNLTLKQKCCRKRCQ